MGFFLLLCSLQQEKLNGDSMSPETSFPKPEDEPQPQYIDTPEGRKLVLNTDEDPVAEALGADLLEVLGELTGEMDRVANRIKEMTEQNQKRSKELLENALPGEGKYLVDRFLAEVEPEVEKFREEMNGIMQMMSSLLSGLLSIDEYRKMKQRKIEQDQNPDQNRPSQIRG
jgi:hypothetical protein